MNGDIEILRFVVHFWRLAFSLVVDHDDEKWEYAYQARLKNLSSTP